MRVDPLNVVLLADQIYNNCLELGFVKATLYLSDELLLILYLAEGEDPNQRPHFNPNLKALSKHKRKHFNLNLKKLQSKPGKLQSKFEKLQSKPEKASIHI